MTTCLYCNNKNSKDELEAKDAEILRLRAALRHIQDETSDGVRKSFLAKTALEEAK